MPSPGEGIVGFLRARYEEQRALALAATAGPWRAEPFVYGRPEDGWGKPEHWEITAGRADVVGHQPHEGGGVYSESDARHIEAHGPDVVLADLDAKLAVLDEHQDVNEGDCGTCVDGRWGYPTDGGSSPQRYPCRTLRHLAVPFAEHPDCDEGWRP